MKISCIIYPIYVIVITSILISGCKFGEGPVLHFIKSVSEVAIPSRTRTIAEFDQGEIEAIGKYQVDKKDLRLFRSAIS
jgi:hypothetical protein